MILPVGPPSSSSSYSSAGSSSSSSSSSSSFAAATFALQIVTLDVDELLHRLFLLLGGGSGGLTNPRRRPDILQEAFTLTSLDPRRLAPPIESSGERLANMANVCETYEVSGTVTAALNRFGFRSVTQLSLLDPDAPILAAKFSAVGCSEYERRSLSGMIAKLNDGRPLEPLYSLKRYFHYLRRERKEDERLSKLEYLDLSSDSSRRKIDHPLKRYRENYNESCEVQNKLLVSTFRADGEPYVFAKLSIVRIADFTRAPPDLPLATLSSSSSSSLLLQQVRSPSPEQIIRFGESSSRVASKWRKGRAEIKLGKDTIILCNLCHQQFTSQKFRRYCPRCYSQINQNYFYGYWERRRCDNVGCPFVAGIGLVKRHSREDCLFRTCNCPWIGCPFFGPLQGMVLHLETRHAPILALHVQESDRRNKLASKEAFTWINVSASSIFPNWRKGNPDFSRLFWEPKRFHFDSITFFVMFYRQEVSKDENWKRTKKGARFCLWIWSLATPKITDNYYYELTVPYGNRDAAGGDGDFPAFRQEALAKSLQMSKEDIFVQSKKLRVPRGAVFIDEGLLQKNISKYGGYLYFQLRMSKC